MKVIQKRSGELMCRQSSPCMSEDRSNRQFFLDGREHHEMERVCSSDPTHKINPKSTWDVALGPDTSPADGQD